MTDQEIDLSALTGAPFDATAEHFGPNNVVFYDPSRCEESGYFAAMALMQLAEIRSLPFQPEAGLSPLMQGMLILASGAYSAQGISLACLVPEVSNYLTRENDTKKVPFRLIENVLCFAVCLNLMVKRQTPEQIVATYGSIMPQSFRRKIRQACRQIDSFDQELKLLRVLSDPKAKNLTDVSWGPRYDAIA